ncbi:MAG: alanine racemase [Nitrospiraceae bacterium]|nr:alanine racemase [Nitrospiraceae bacterium]
MSADLRPAWAEVSKSALAENYSRLSRLAAPAGIMAVVKADAYGHGAVTTAGVLFDAGCRRFAVALVDEGVELRRAGIDGEILVLSEVPPETLEVARSEGISVTVYTPAAAKLAAAQPDDLLVHLKLDTGMYRVGARLAELAEIAEHLRGRDLQGFWSHFAVADEESRESREFTALQLRRFEEGLVRLAKLGVTPKERHIANTAGLLYHPSSRYDRVRVGLGIYGYHPGSDRSGVQLVPALSLVSKVAFVKEVEEGERPSYGRRRPLTTRSKVATVPIGYADGVPRALFTGGGEVLIAGRRYPLAGMVTMDQLVVDLGPDSDVQSGDEVVLIGASGEERVGADEWAQRTGTITWEVLCGISKRIPRRLVEECRG